MRTASNKSLQAPQDGRSNSAVALHVASRRLLSFFR